MHIIVFFIVSLNQEKRRKELLRVSKENATLAKRIIERRPDTNRENYRHTGSKNTAYSDNSSRVGSDSHNINVSENILLIINDFSSFQSTNQQTHDTKPVVKRSQSELRDDKKGIKALVMTNETPTTKPEKQE